MGRLRDLSRHARKLRDELAERDAPADLAETFGPYRDDPAGFVQNILGARSGTRRSNGAPYQLDILTDVARCPRVSVRSGHGVGKSTLDAWAALWWLLTRPYGRVVIVAPEFSRQIRAVLFAEIRKWVRRSKVPLPVDVLANRATVEGFGDEWGIIGIPATEPDRIEGFHAEGGLLLILDETKGIPTDVYDALMGALTGLEDNRLLITSTPGPPSGIFHAVHTKAREDWRLHHIPSTDSSLVSAGWVEQRRREWGEGSPLFQARVMGEFPEEAEGTLFKLSDLEAAIGRELEQEEPGITLGVDPARFGPDKTAVAVWKGRQLVEVMTRQGLDTMETASWVASLINRMKPGRVRVDPIGIGAGVLDRLRQLEHAAEELNASASPDRTDLHSNKRAEAYWDLSQALERGEVSLPDDDQLMAELSAIRYGFDRRGRIQIESKDDIRKRIGRSPDSADAAVIGFAAGAGEPVGRFAYVGGSIVDLDEGEIIDRRPFRSGWDREGEHWEEVARVGTPGAIELGD